MKILEALLYLGGTIAVTSVLTQLWLEILGTPVLSEDEWEVIKALRASCTISET